MRFGLVALLLSNTSVRVGLRLAISYVARKRKDVVVEMASVTITSIHDSSSASIVSAILELTEYDTDDGSEWDYANGTL